MVLTRILLRSTSPHLLGLCLFFLTPFFHNYLPLYLKTSKSKLASFDSCHRRLDMIQGLEEIAKLNIPKDLSSEETNKYLIDACSKFDVKCPPPQTTARLLDKVSYMLSFCITALFVINLSSICAFNLWWYLTYNLLIEGYMFDESAFFAKSSTKILFYTRTPSKAIYCYFHIVFCYWKQLYYCTSRSLSVIFLKKHAWTLHLLSTIQR